MTNDHETFPSLVHLPGFANLVRRHGLDGDKRAAHFDCEDPRHDAQEVLNGFVNVANDPRATDLLATAKQRNAANVFAILWENQAPRTDFLTLAEGMVQYGGVDAQVLKAALVNFGAQTNWNVASAEEMQRAMRCVDRVMELVRLEAVRMQNIERQNAGAKDTNLNAQIAWHAKHISALESAAVNFRAVMLQGAVAQLKGRTSETRIQE